MRMVIRSTGNVQVRKVYLTQFCDMKSIVALYCSSHSTRLDRWLSWWYPVYILLNLIHCFWTRTTQRVFPFNFYLCNCTYFHVQYPPCRKLWNCGKAPEFELWPALILKEESTKEEEEDMPGDVSEASLKFWVTDCCWRSTCKLSLMSMYWQYLLFPILSWPR